MYVVTADQRSSRRHPDEVPSVLRALRTSPVIRRFERTVGDEVQGLMTDPEAVVDVVLQLVRRSDWSVGIGVGHVDEPLPRSVRAARGHAFVRARVAVERAKSAPARVAVEGADPRTARLAEAGLWLLAGLVQRRTPAGWEVADVMRGDVRQVTAAERLGISAQAVSQRLRVAGWHEELRGRELAARLLADADAHEDASEQAVRS